MMVNILEQGAVVLIEVKEERLDAHNSGSLKTEMLSLFEDGIVLVQGPHIGRPGPVRADLVVERRPEPRRAGAEV